MPKPKDYNKEIPVKIETGVYYFEDEDGEPVFDFEEMRREYEEKLKGIAGDKYESPS